MNSRIRDNVVAMAAYVPGEQPSDPAIVKLNTNENPYPPAPGVLEVLRAAGEAGLRLYPDPLCLRLRESIARLHGCSVEQVFCGNGSDEVLALCIRAFVPDGGRIGCFVPSYSVYPVLADAAGVFTATLPLAPDFSWPAIPRDYEVPLFFWTNPNAPTGLRCDAEVIRRWAARTGGVVVVDEAYVDFATADCSRLALEAPNVLVTRTLSKSYSLAGIRLGYALGPAELIGALNKIKDAYNVNGLTQLLARAAIEDQSHMRANAKRIIATRERIAAALRERGWEVFASEANFLWIRPPHEPAETVLQQLRERGVLVRHFAAARTRAYLRVTVGSDAQMDAFLAAL